MITYLVDILRVSVSIILFFLILIILEKETATPNKSILVLFICSIIGFLIAYWEPVQANTAVFYAFFIFSVAFPFLFFLITKVFFDDDFVWRFNKYWYVIIAYSITLGLYLTSFSHSFYLLKILPYSISGFFILLTAFETIRTFHIDLNNSRRVVRLISVFISSLFALVSVYSFYAQDPLSLPDIMLLVLIFFILLFVYLFFKGQIMYTPVFYTPPRTDIYSLEDRGLIVEKILKVILEKKRFTTEGFTIKMMSEIIDEQEYLVRKTINGKLGYSNFNQFLNHYRIEESLSLISEIPEKKYTFQEIAFQLGYQSVSTFNRAFKNKMGKTPTDYYKDQVRIQ